MLHGPSGHVARDLTNRLRPSPFQSAMEHVLLPVHKDSKVIQEEHSILLPHKLWSHMYSYDEGLFVEYFLGGSSGNASRFWKSMADTKLITKLQMLNLDPSKTVPLKFFADGIACTGISKTWARSADAFLFSSLLGSRNSKISEVLRGS